MNGCFHYFPKIWWRSGTMDLGTSLKSVIYIFNNVNLDCKTAKLVEMSPNEGKPSPSLGLSVYRKPPKAINRQSFRKWGIPLRFLTFFLF